jgi:hypothetical protein
VNEDQQAKKQKSKKAKKQKSKKKEWFHGDLNPDLLGQSQAS